MFSTWKARRLMTHEASSTMVSSKAADTSFKTVVSPSKSKRLKVMLVQKIVVERTHSFTIWVYFLPLPAKQKFLPILSMRSFFIKLLKVKPSIAVMNPTNKQQIVLLTDMIPTTEAKFKNSLQYRWTHMQTWNSNTLSLAVTSSVNTHFARSNSTKPRSPSSIGLQKNMSLWNQMPLE